MSEKMEARIAALLRKAESTDSTEEAEALNAKAQELMVKYSIETIREEGLKGTLQDINVHRFTLNITEMYAKALIPALHNAVITELGTCRLLLDVSRGPKSFLVIGSDREVEAAMSLVDSLLVQAQQAAKRWYSLEVVPLYGQQTRAEEKRMKRQFLISFSRAAVAQLHLTKLAAEAESHTTGTDLVLVSEGKRVDAYISENIRTSTGKASRMMDSGLGHQARLAGRRDGIRANLGNQL